MIGPTYFTIDPTTWLIIAATTSIALLLLLCGVACVYTWRRTKGKKGNTTPGGMTWELYDFYDSESSQNSEQEEPILPNWLNRRRDMIFPSSDVSRDDRLGSGQYGTVHKAKLFRGNAVYVI